MNICLDITGIEGARHLRVRDEYGREIAERVKLGTEDVQTFVFWQVEVQKWQDKGFSIVKIGPGLGDVEMSR